MVRTSLPRLPDILDGERVKIRVADASSFNDRDLYHYRQALPKLDAAGNPRVLN